jgi:hypothetical protein
MYDVQGITDDANQVQTVVLPDGSTMSLALVYSPMQYGWFMDITYGSFILQGFRVHTSPNMLHQYKNQIPFGLACFTTDGYEPTQQQDFDQGYAVLDILTSDEVAQYEALLSG